MVSSRRSRTCRHPATRALLWEATRLSASMPGRKALNAIQVQMVISTQRSESQGSR